MVRWDQMIRSIEPYGVFSLSVALLLVTMGSVFPVFGQQRKPINPYPRQVRERETVEEWTFEDGSGGWNAVHDTRLTGGNGQLQVESLGTDPYMHAPGVRAKGPVRIKLRIRSTTAEAGEVFWTTESAPDWDPERKRAFDMTHDGNWHTYHVDLPVEGTLTRFRLDPGRDQGRVEVDYVSLVRIKNQPLTIERLQVRKNHVRADVRNHRDHPVSFVASGREREVEANATVNVSVSLDGKTPFERVRIRVNPKRFASIQRVAVVHHSDVEMNGPKLENGTLRLQVTTDGAGGARVFRNGRLTAVLTPLLEKKPLEADRRIPSVSVQKEGKQIRISGNDVLQQYRLRLHDQSIRYKVDAEEDVGGPVVRALGHLEQGLFSGLEYLGEGERSSSRKDIRTPEHVRYAPDPMKVTMPLMGFITSRASVGFSWKDMSHQPVFATPNFFDGSADHRMRLIGDRQRGAVRIGAGWERGERLSEVIEWAVKRRGLPEPAKPPRSFEEQKDLSLRAYRGPLSGNGGWGSCTDRERCPRNYYSDHVSAIWRLSGSIPDVPELVPGGAHVANPASFFVMDRVQQWKNHLKQKATSAFKEQKEDGSFRYDGKYREGHFENTASGYCAKKAYALLNHAWYTGNKESLRAGEKALRYMNRFRTPRGAQTWEIPLHTPDVLASAYLVKAYTRGYQMTGNRKFLKHARKWAFTGLPFIYQWSKQPGMRYATIPVYGATNWKAPNWIGQPVQWCGTVYADAILSLAPFDDTLNWEKLARGITISGERQQYPNGPEVGTLPDAITLATFTRQPPNINPGALVSLRYRLEGKLDDLSVAQGNGHRVVAPYPVSIEADRALIESDGSGIRYQVLIDGNRVVSRTASGNETVRFKDPSRKE